MEWGVLALRGRDALGGERGVAGGDDEVDEESGKCIHGLGMDDMRNCQGMGVAQANRLQGLAISRNSESHEFEMDVNACHPMQLHLTTQNLVGSTFRYVWIAR